MWQWDRFYSTKVSPRQYHSASHRRCTGVQVHITLKKEVHCLIILTLLSIYPKTVHGTRDLPAGVSEWCCLLCIFRKVSRVEDFVKQHICIRAGSCLLLTDRRANLVTKLWRQWETMRCWCLSAESPGMPFLRTRRKDSRTSGILR